MSMKILHQSLVLLVCCLYFVSTKLKVIDLTHAFDNSTTIYWPSMKQWSFQIYSVVPENAASYYESNRFCTAEHGGTHIDAPRHFAQGTHGVHEIPLDKTIGNPFIVDVSSEAASHADLLINVKHIEAAEKVKGKIPDHSILILYTGWSKYWPDLKKYLGTASNDTSLLHFPGLHPDAAKWLVKNRKVKSVGVDTASIDYGQSKTFESHAILYAANIPGFENVNLKDIDKFKDKKDVMIYALPMKIKDGSGAPLRIVATYDDSVTSGSVLFKFTPSLVAGISFACFAIW